MLQLLFPFFLLLPERMAWLSCFLILLLLSLLLNPAAQEGIPPMQLFHFLLLRGGGSWPVHDNACVLKVLGNEPGTREQVHEWAGKCELEGHDDRCGKRVQADSAQGPEKPGSGPNVVSWERD